MRQDPIVVGEECIRLRLPFLAVGAMTVGGIPEDPDVFSNGIRRSECLWLPLGVEELDLLRLKLAPEEETVLNGG